MVDKFNDNLKKRDLDLILEVNKKAIEIETSVVEQNEDIIAQLDDIEKSNSERDLKLDKIIEQGEKLIKQGDENSKDLFRIQVLFVTGLLSLVMQILQIFFLKH